MAEFGRQVKVTFGVPGTEGQTLEGLRVAFEIQMSRTSKPNQAKITIFNPAPDSVALVQKKGTVVILEAGYETTFQLFRGTPNANGTFLKRTGQTRVLTIEAQDGQAEVGSSRVSCSFSTQTTSGQIFDELVAALGLPRGTIDFDRTILSTRGIVLVGSAADALTNLVESQGRQWFIRDGVIQVIKPSEGTGEASVLFSADAKNLIGAPIRTKEGVKVTGLLAPTLRPGKPFRVESRDITGDYIAGDVSFRGDSWSGPFFVIATGRPI